MKVVFPAEKVEKRATETDFQGSVIIYYSGKSCLVHSDCCALNDIFLIEIDWILDALALPFLLAKALKGTSFECLHVVQRNIELQGDLFKLS